MDQFDRSVVGGLMSISPRPGFPGELLSALRNASHLPVRLTVVDPTARGPWPLAGAVTGAAIGSAGAAVLVYRRFARGRRA
ncbi:MAG: hypothetical protein M3391_12065 [Actinomycetota bacterium]|nr:hypothetical protein [Actinomycetota bacterium]